LAEFLAVFSLHVDSQLEQRTSGHTDEKVYRMKAGERIGKRCAEIGKAPGEQNAAISNIEVTDGNIKSFERTANKYGIDYALKKDTSEQPPRYLVFFKGRDVDVMTQAFKEFSAKTVKQKEKQSLKQKLSRSREQSKAQHKEKVKTKDRGVEL